MKPVSEMQWHAGLTKYAAMKDHGGDIAMAYYIRLLATRPINIPRVALELIGLPPGYAACEEISRRFMAVDQIKQKGEYANV